MARRPVGFAIDQHACVIVVDINRNQRYGSQFVVRFSLIAINWHVDCRTFRRTGYRMLKEKERGRESNKKGY